MIDSKFDNLIHAPNRLQLCAMLDPAEEIEYAAVKDQLKVSDSVLSKQVWQLEKAGYILSIKRASLGRSRTWIGLTQQGRLAYRAHIEALKEIVGSL